MKIRAEVHDRTSSIEAPIVAADLPPGRAEANFGWVIKMPTTFSRSASLQVYAHLSAAKHKKNIRHLRHIDFTLPRQNGNESAERKRLDGRSLFCTLEDSIRSVREAVLL